jgi:hypothetical protein
MRLRRLVFLVNNEPGGAPDLRRHPYPETGPVRRGFTAGDDEIEVGPR